jgi:hypothetical protein
MALKMRFLYFSKKAQMKQLAAAIKTEFGLTENNNATDIIPPAYSCERERLVVIVASASANMPNPFQLFCKDLSRDRAQNVAFIIDGTPEDAAKVVEMAKTGNSNVMEDKILYMQGGLPFKFLRGVKPEEMEQVKAWVADIRSNLA